MTALTDFLTSTKEQQICLLFLLNMLFCFWGRKKDWKSIRSICYFLMLILTLINIFGECLYYLPIRYETPYDDPRFVAGHFIVLTVTTLYIFVTEMYLVYAAGGRIRKRWGVLFFCPIVAASISLAFGWSDLIISLVQLIFILLYIFVVIRYWKHLNLRLKKAVCIVIVVFFIANRLDALMGDYLSGSTILLLWDFAFFYALENPDVEETKHLLLHVVSSLASAIDAKDSYTNGHSSRVAMYSREIARRYGYDYNRLEEIYMMGLLHDVGKIGVPTAVINKPGKLTDEEYSLIKKHPILGAKILGNITEMPLLQTGARWHHERFDGKGYPDSLAGKDIPEEARIIAVADSYDAMTSRRSYRDPLPQEIVRQEIEKGAGTQFDPEFAKIMLEMIDEDTEYKMKEA